MHELLEGLRIAVSLVFLSYASWHDYRSREVSNKVWVFFAPLGLTLTILQVLVTNQAFLLTILVLSFLILAGITIVLFYLGFFGGADVKAFICLSLAMPFEPVTFRPILSVVSPLYGMSIFGNAVIASALTAVAMMLYNILWYARTGGKLFEGLEHESTIKKLLAMVSGYKVEVSELRRKFYLVPIEVFSSGENGMVTRSLRLFIRTNLDREASVAKVESFAADLERIWVTPYLPFIVFIMIGFVLTLLIGDIIFWLITIIL